MNKCNNNCYQCRDCSDSIQLCNLLVYIVPIVLVHVISAYSLDRLLAFGASRRVCVGENLAKNRLFLMVTSLLQHFEFLPADPDQLPKHDPREYDTGFLIKPQQYFVKLVPRQ